MSTPARDQEMIMCISGPHDGKRVPYQGRAFNVVKVEPMRGPMASYADATATPMLTCEHVTYTERQFNIEDRRFYLYAADNLTDGQIFTALLVGYKP